MNRKSSNDYTMFIADEPSCTPCNKCGGEVVEFSIQDNIWNTLVRPDEKEHDKEYLCVWCFLDHAIDYVAKGK